jgi:hypothetical protein
MNLQIKVLNASTSREIDAAFAKAMPTSVPAAPQRTPVSSLRVVQLTMATNPISTLL